LILTRCQIRPDGDVKTMKTMATFYGRHQEGRSQSFMENICISSINAS